MTGVALFRISQPKPEAQFEPKKKLGTHQCSRHHPRPKGVEDRGVRAQLCALVAPYQREQEGGSPSPWNRDHELITQSFPQDAASPGDAITNPLPPLLLKLAVDQDSSRAILLVPD